MDRKVIKTIHGSFAIETNDLDAINGWRQTCQGCWYRYRKIKGAPCVEGKNCGDLYSYLVPIKLVKSII